LKTASTILITLFIFLTSSTFCQKRPTKPGFSCDTISNCNDCNNIFKIKALGSKKFDCTPTGYGSKLEILNNDKTDSCYLSKEHNTLWIWFTSAYSGEFTFNIIPHNNSYDYDFMLYSLASNDFCDDISNKKLSPLRTNKSRNDTLIKSITGLSVSADKRFVNSGPGDSYSKSVKTKKGDSYALIIDNYYKGDEGFNLKFKYYEYLTIKGYIIDEKTNKPITADLFWEDITTGEQLASSKSSATGEFSFKVLIDKQRPKSEYSLNTNAANFQFADQIFSGDLVKENKNKPIKPEATELKVDDKIILNNVNFEINSNHFSKSSLPALRKIKRLLESNPTLKIEIEGHTNGCGDDLDAAQLFSEERAKSIKQFFVDQGIDEARISTIGYNCSKMLYPDENNPYHAKANRRVEILITDV
jgi:outer membrane protein OmpA-like peptidoglycan-associated protein